MTIIKRNLDMKEFFKEELGLCNLHWDEIALNKDKVALKPDYDRYMALQQAGILFNLVAYDEGLMVGYSILLVQPHLHYRDDLYAYVDVIYVDPLYRNSRIGLHLIKETEVLAKEMGVSVLLHHTKPHHTNLEKILVRKGYSLNEHIYGKLLKE